MISGSLILHTKQLIINILNRKITLGLTTYKLTKSKFKLTLQSMYYIFNNIIYYNI